MESIRDRQARVVHKSGRVMAGTDGNEREAKIEDRQDQKEGTYDKIDETETKVD